MNDKSKITVSVIVDRANRETSVKRTGDKTPISWIQSVSPAHLASAYRDAAAYFLNLAAEQENDRPTLRDQMAAMYQDHKPLLFSE